MEFDGQKAARVWQRVQGQQTEQPGSKCCDHLQGLIMDQLTLSSMYLQLSRQFSGRDGATMMRLARESRAQAACMRGVLMIAGAQMPGAGPVPVQSGSMDAMLRRCYGQELRLLKEYENRKTDGEYGPVFDRMAGRSREHCCALLELAGGAGRK